MAGFAGAAWKRALAWAGVRPRARQVPPAPDSSPCGTVWGMPTRQTASGQVDGQKHGSHILREDAAPWAHCWLSGAPLTSALFPSKVRQKGGQGKGRWEGPQAIRHPVAVPPPPPAGSENKHEPLGH